MPWRETDRYDERVKFVSQVLAAEWDVDELCSSYGVSRKTGYKMLARYRESGFEGLRDQSRAPQLHPNQTSEEVEGMVLVLRALHGHWGPKKLRRLMEKSNPGRTLPALSTIGGILKRHGLVVPRRRRSRAKVTSLPFVKAEGPNDVWRTDFKGAFKAKDGARCEPLTLTDEYSRFALMCRLMARTGGAHVRPAFEAAFREFGLPKRLRTDNGPPFASVGLCGLSRLSIWWLKLGIEVEHIAPGKPQENGGHERFHLTLKQETALPPKATRKAQQAASERFLDEYNHVRPHEALGMKTPAELYEASPRPYPRQLPEFEYPRHFEVRNAKADGYIMWKGRLYFVSESLAREAVGLEPVADGRWRIYLGRLELGTLDEEKHAVLKNKGMRYRQIDEAQE